MSEEKTNNPSRIGTLVLVLLFIAIGLFLRLDNYAEESIWWDEFSSMIHLAPPAEYEESPHFHRWQQVVIQQVAPSLMDYWSANRELDPATMPLYYSMQYLWWNTTGRDIPTLRLLTVLLSVIALPLVFLLGRAMYGTSAGLTALMLLAMSPIHAQMGQEIRMYALFATLVVASVYTFYHVVEHGGLPWGMANAIVNLLLFWTHPFAVWVPFIEGLFLVLLYWHRLRLMLTWGVLHVVLLIPSAAYVSTIEFFDEEETAGWMTIPEPWGLALDIFADDFIGLTAQIWPKTDTLENFVSPETAQAILDVHGYVGVSLMVLFGALIAALIATTVWLATRPDAPEEADTNQRDWRWIVFLLMWAILPPLILYTLSHLWRPMIMPRYTMHCSIAFYLLAGGGVAALRWNAARVPVLLLLFFGYAYQHAITLEGPHHPDWKHAGEHIRENADPEDVILIHDWLWRRVGAYNLGPVQNVISWGGNHRYWEFENLAELGFNWLEIDAPKESSPGEQRGLWMMVRMPYYVPHSATLLEEALTSRGLAFEHWEFKGMQHVWVYRVYDDPDTPNPGRHRRTTNETVVDQFCELALELWRAQQYEEAVQIARRATFLDDNASLPYSYMGMSLKELKEWPKAAHAFEEALKRNTEYPWDLINLGTCYIEMQQPATALPHLQLACEKLPNDQTAHAELARCLIELGRCEEAVAFIDETLPRMDTPTLRMLRERCTGEELEG